MKVPVLRAGNLTVNQTIPKDNGLKVPHIGWNSVSLKQKDGSFLKILMTKAIFILFIRFYLDGADEDVVAGVTQYGVPIEVCGSKGQALCGAVSP